MGINLAVYSNPAKYGGREGVLLYSMLFLPLAGLSLLAKSTQQLGFGVSGTRLTERIRMMAFRNLIRQDMYYYDREENSAGALASRLATDADAIKRVSGPLGGQLITVTITTLMGLGIAFAYGWQLTLLVLACAPLLFASSMLERKALAGYSVQTKKSYERSGQLAGLILGNIKTVIMLGKENAFVKEYHGNF